MKKLSILFACIFMLLGSAPISAFEEEEELILATPYSYQEHVDSLLNGFYDERMDEFEIFYGESQINEKTEFYNDTVNLYQNRKYDDILNYIVENEITVVENHLSNAIQPFAQVYPIVKTASKTYSPVSGCPITITANFSGSYQKPNGTIQNLSASHSMSYSTNIANYTSVSYPNKSFTKTINGSTATLKVTTGIKIVLANSATSVSYPNQVFQVTLP